MKRLFCCLAIICILFSFSGCKPKYVKAGNIEEIYSQVIYEVENAKTSRDKVLAYEKAKLDILKAQIWYLKNDPNNPMAIQLGELYSIMKD